jgi:hypothetical protein
MVYVRTKSGRFISVDHIVGFAIEDQTIEVEGKRRMVYNVIAYLPEHLYHAILATYSDHDTAQKNLENFVEKIRKLDTGIVGFETEI